MNHYFSLERIFHQHHYTAVRRQNTLTLISEIVEWHNFSDTADNSTYVSDVQSFITKVLCSNFSANIFLTQDINAW